MESMFVEIGVWDNNNEQMWTFLLATLQGKGRNGVLVFFLPTFWREFDEASSY